MASDVEDLVFPLKTLPSPDPWPYQLWTTTIIPFIFLFWLNKANEWTSKADRTSWVMLLHIILEMKYNIKKIYTPWELAEDTSLKCHLQTDLSELEQWWVTLKVSLLTVRQGNIRHHRAGKQELQGLRKESSPASKIYRTLWPQVLFCLPRTYITRIKFLGGQEFGLFCSLLLAQCLEVCLTYS